MFRFITCHIRILAIPLIIRILLKTDPESVRISFVTPPKHLIWLCRFYMKSIRGKIMLLYRNYRSPCFPVIIVTVWLCPIIFYLNHWLGLIHTKRLCTDRFCLIVRQVLACDCQCIFPILCKKHGCLMSVALTAPPGNRYMIKLSISGHFPFHQSGIKILLHYGYGSHSVCCEESVSYGFFLVKGYLYFGSCDINLHNLCRCRLIARPVQCCHFYTGFISLELGSINQLLRRKRCRLPQLVFTDTCLGSMIQFLILLHLT